MASFMDLVGRLASQIPGAAQSRATHGPMLFTDSPLLMDVLAPGDWGATLGKASIVGPGSTKALDSGRPGDMQGVPRHEIVHQIMGDTKLAPEDLFKALPPDISERMRNHLTQNIPRNQWGQEIAARLGSSGVDYPGSDPRTTQAYTLGLSSEQAQQTWNTYLSLLSKQNPQMAAKLLRFSRPAYQSNEPQLAAQNK
jgi:hypothetical protein